MLKKDDIVVFLYEPGRHSKHRLKFHGRTGTYVGRSGHLAGVLFHGTTAIALVPISGLRQYNKRFKFTLIRKDD